MHGIGFLLSVAFSTATLLAPSPCQDCSNTSVGFTPLVDLGDGSHRGFRGGLYQDGLGVAPGRHWTAALRRASALMPRDAAGNPVVDGRIGLLAIGMSNTTREFSTFVDVATRDPRMDRRVVPVDGAFGGSGSGDWVDPNAMQWSMADQRLAAAGITPRQVAVLWLKQATENSVSAFPSDALRLRADLTAIVANALARYPNLALCYLSSRTYSGYATRSGHCIEPCAYETGFAVKWLIQDQVDGRPELNHDAARGPVRAPLLLWGPYLWADGLVPRSDGLTWLCQDFASDGIHPSSQGSRKVAQMLLEFFVSDPSASPWFAVGRVGACARADVATIGSGTLGERGEPQLAAVGLPVPGRPFAVRVTGAATSAPAFVLFGVDAIDVPLLGGSLRVQPIAILATSTDRLGMATLALGNLPADSRLCGFAPRWQALVADPAHAQGATLSAALVTVVGD